MTYINTSDSLELLKEALESAHHAMVTRDDTTVEEIDTIDNLLKDVEKQLETSAANPSVELD